jgi:hypothetical protein
VTPWTFDTEAIYQALFALVSSVTTAQGQKFVTASRRLRHWADTNASDQPAVFQCQGQEDYKTRQGLPPVVTLNSKLWIYAKIPGDTGAVASSQLNPLKDAVFAALNPSPVTGLQTLGGLVYHAWIEGSALTDEGVLGDQAVIVLPVKIVVNN